MAYISAANGTLTFNPTFAKKHQDLIKNWVTALNDEQDDGYGINLFTTTDPLNNLNFYGQGRCWNFDNSAANAFIADYYEGTLKDAITKLVAVLKENPDESVAISFTDYEPGAGFIDTVDGVIDFSNEIPEFIATNTEYLTYDDKTKIEQGFEEGYQITDDWTKIIKTLRHNGEVTISEEHAAKLKQALLADKETLNGYICDWRLDDPEYLLEDYL